MVSIVIGYEGFDEGKYYFVVRGIEGLTYSFIVENYQQFQDEVIVTIRRVCSFCGLPEDGFGLHVLIDYIPD